MPKNSKNGQPEADGDQEAMLVRHLLADACGNDGLDPSAPDLPDRIVVVREIIWETTADDLLRAFRHIGVIQAATADQKRHAGLVVFCCHAAAVQAIRQPMEKWSEFEFGSCEPAPAAMVLSTSRSATSASDGEVCPHLLSAAVPSVMGALTPALLADIWSGLGLGTEESPTSMEGGARSFLERIEKIGSLVITMCAQETTEIIHGFLSTLTSDGAVHQRLLDDAVASALATEVLTFLAERSTGISGLGTEENGGKSSHEESEKIGSVARNAPSTEVMAHRRLRAVAASALASGMLKALDERQNGIGHGLDDCTAGMDDTRSILGDKTKLSSEKVASSKAELRTTEGTSSATAESTSAASVQGGLPFLTPDQLALPTLYGAAVCSLLNQPNRTLVIMHPHHLACCHSRTSPAIALHGAYINPTTWYQMAYSSSPLVPTMLALGLQENLQYFNQIQGAYSSRMTQWQPAFLSSSMEPPVGAAPSSGMQGNIGYVTEPRIKNQQLSPNAEPYHVRRSGHPESATGGRSLLREKGGGESPQEHLRAPPNTSKKFGASDVPCKEHVEPQENGEDCSDAAATGQG